MSQFFLYSFLGISLLIRLPVRIILKYSEKDILAKIDLVGMIASIVCMICGGICALIDGDLEPWLFISVTILFGGFALFIGGVMIWNYINEKKHNDSRNAKRETIPKTKEKHIPQEISFVNQIAEYVRNFMICYIKEFPLSSDDVIPIFSNANEMIKGLSEKELRKSMKTNCVNIEFGALNIIQNFAMAEIKPRSAVDFIKGVVRNENHAIELYNYVNELKLKKGYISKEQFDENELLATKLSIQSPLENRF